MSVTAIVGANWGDEGKGKITDWMAKEADYIVRFQGGSNAGHTIINEYGKVVLNLLPSGVFHPHTTNVIGPGVALNLTELFKEWDQLIARGVPEPRLKVSSRAQLVLPYHLLMDEWEEERLASRQFGSTKQGIAPFYADKYLKVGIQVADLYGERDQLIRKLEQALAGKTVLARHLYRKAPWNWQDAWTGLMELAERLRPFVCDTTVLLREARESGQKILLEGQLGALRDPDHGIYPYSTSSSTLAGFASVGAGLPPHAVTRIISVVKAYSSCVGAGPFVTELQGETAEQLRVHGGDAGEFGARTGRPRRVGWFDAVATRYGCQIQGSTEAILTNLDVLGYLEEIPICTAYKIDGKRVTEFPETPKLNNAEPDLEVMPGWKCPISGVRSYSQLPRNAQCYVERLEEEIGIRFSWISCGPGREEIVPRGSIRS
ncbi:adenylosuccinate synthase [Paenibacillus senegalensis]|uniref:adenylosuccinate synthase n=1 Tax=Paenibacillus senegalensis TaxID=1465766 RepID=UPI0002892253|nr:adenylosuccinate synthase [Paenibacillus senegalensis]